VLKNHYFLITGKGVPTSRDALFRALSKIPSREFRGFRRKDYYNLCNLRNLRITLLHWMRSWLFGLKRYHTCAITTAGGYKCWGHNFYGEIGDNTSTDRFTSVDVVWP